MQPENSIQNGPNVPVTENAGSDVVFQDKPKKNLGVILGMVFLAILAVGGIGFGVWAMMDGNSQKEQLNEQISTLKSQNSELMDKLENNTTENIDVVIDEGTGSTINVADYIYVEEWGLKIKVPDTLEMVTYKYDYGDGYTVLGVSGATKDGQITPDFARIGNCMLGAVDRFSKTNVEMGVVPDYYGEPFMSDDGYSYYFNGPQAVCTSDQNNQQWEESTAGIIRNMLSDPDNYSKI